MIRRPGDRGERPTPTPTPTPMEEARLVPADNTPEPPRANARGTGTSGISSPFPPVLLNHAPALIPVMDASTQATQLFIRGGQVVARTEGVEVQVRTARVIARLHVLDVEDAIRAGEAICDSRTQLLEYARRITGESEQTIRDLQVRVVGPGQLNVDLHIREEIADNGSANRVGHLLASKVAELTRGKIVVRVMSTVGDLRMAHARVRISAEALESEAEPVFPTALVTDWARRANDPAELLTMHDRMLASVRALLDASGQLSERVIQGIALFAERRGTVTPLVQWQVQPDGALFAEFDLPIVMKDLAGDVVVLAEQIAAVALLTHLGDLLTHLPPEDNEPTERSSSRSFQPVPPSATAPTQFGARGLNSNWGQMT